MSHIATRILFLAIMLICTFFAFRSQRITIINGDDVVAKFHKPYLFLSCIIAWFFLAFTNIGVDYNSYYMIAYRSNWDTYNNIISVEPGFAILCTTIKNIVGNNPDAVIFFLKTIQIGLAFLSIYILREKIDVGYAVLAYMTLVYLPSFYLLSIVLAGSIVFVAIALVIKREKYIFPLLLILLAAQLHNAVYLFVPAYLAIWVLNRNKNLSRLYRYLILIAYIIISFSSSQIFGYFQNIISGFHYGNYKLTTISGSGLMVIIMYLPLVCIVYLLSKYNIDTDTMNEIFIFAITSFLFNILSYQFRVIERMELVLAPLYMLLFPKTLYSSGIIIRDGRTQSKTLVYVVYILYLAFRAYLVFTSRTTVQSGMSQYNFFMPF